jgi:hypothetical protein
MKFDFKICLSSFRKNKIVTQKKSGRVIRITFDVVNKIKSNKSIEAFPRENVDRCMSIRWENSKFCDSTYAMYSLQGLCFVVSCFAENFETRAEIF